MAGYYEYATPGDIIKGHDAFATFSSDRKWIGNLKTMRPGEGYLIRRLAPTDGTVPFYNQPLSAAAPVRMAMPAKDEPETAIFHTSSATNMTIIAKVLRDDVQGTKVNVYIGDELVGVASPLSEASPLYFLTIQSDRSGTLRFETENGTRLSIVNYQLSIVNYLPDAHYGSLDNPVILTPSPEDGNGYQAPYKILENGHVVIIRNNEKYDLTGKEIK